MAFTEMPVLVGDHVRLEPLAPEHASDMRAASADGELWRTWYTSIPAPDAMGAEIEHRLALHRAGSVMPWAVCDPSGRAVGMTTYLNIDEMGPRLEIGSTWLARSVQRTAVNTDMKLLLLEYAFETLECIAVEFRTHWHNRQSRAALERLGAQQDGVLRHHSIAAGGIVRDTVVFSIIAPEWPAVRRGLQARLERS